MKLPRRADLVIMCDEMYLKTSLDVRDNMVHGLQGGAKPVKEVHLSVLS